MRQKLAKPSNNSRVSKANRQGNNNGKLFPTESMFFKSKKLIDIHPRKKSEEDKDALTKIKELIKDKEDANLSELEEKTKE